MKKNIAFRFKLFGALLFVCSVASAQSESSLLREVMHHSPNVSSLGKFGEVPVGYYTGVPNISVPIYEATSGPLKLPISLDYHAGGVRVEEIASNVGLSWALQAGGVITRGVRGHPDFPSNWYGIPLSSYMEAHMNSGTSNNLLAQIENGGLDGEADIFYFNFGTRSGKFIFDQSGGIHVIPKVNLLIAGHGMGWRIVDEVGTQYLFQKAEMQGELEFESSWLLTEIISSDNKHNITLSYEPIFISYEASIGETKYFPTNGGCGDCVSNTGQLTTNVSIYAQRLTRIDFESGYIKFEYITPRCDISGDNMLNSISIYTKDNVVMKKFVLGHSYFGDNSICAVEYSHLKRLKLDSVIEVTPSETKPPYVFSYDESTPFPSRFSCSQDHWGYYNGVNNNTLIPGFSRYLSDGLGGGRLMYVLGADRTTNPQTAQLGVLKSIQYPTGGITNFTFESNLVNDARIEGPYGEPINFHYSTPTPNYYPVVDVQNPVGGPLIIPAGGALVDFFEVDSLDGTPWVFCNTSSVWLTKNGEKFLEMRNTTRGDLGWYLDEGTYRLLLDNDCSSQALLPYFRVSIRAKARIGIDSDLRYAGGLRIKRIEDIPGDGGLPVVREFKYTRDTEATKSSGVLINVPIYRSDLVILYAWLISADYAGGPPIIEYPYSYWVTTSQSKSPLSTTSGSYVGYGFVTEIFSNGGKNCYSYTAYGNPITPQIPYPPLEFNDWQRGFLENVKSYVKVGDQWHLARETSNTPVGFDETTVYGLKVGRNQSIVWRGALNEVPATHQIPPVYAYYPTSTRFFALGSTTEKIYPEPGNLSKVIQKKKEYTYDPVHFQVTQEKETLTDEMGGSEVKVLYKKYPTDYGFNPFNAVVGAEALGLKKLQDVHAVGIPIEEYVVKQYQNAGGQVSNQRVISGSLSTFKPDNPYPDQIYKLKLNQPVPFSSFVPSSVAGNSFQKSQFHESLVKFVSYDGKGNLLTQQKANDVPVSYLWGYNNTLPIAEIKNAINASSTGQFSGTNSATALISEYTNETPSMPAFEIVTNQIINASVLLASKGVNVPQSPMVIVRLRKTDETTVFDYNCEWGQNNFSISVGPGVYQWYYSTDDIVFSDGFTGIDLSMSNTCAATQTGNRIFYTSFEDDGNYTSGYYTGEKAWQGQYTLYLPADDGAYKVTYMKWGGGGAENWQYITQDISVTSGTVQPLTIGDAQSIIDEVRLYPAEAQMTTYSYKPEFGITSSADPNGIVTYYDYDSFGRLKCLKDHKRNVVKSFEYHYKGEY